MIFFFQAEDGIRDLTVTGVQTCALPIYWGGCRWCRVMCWWRPAGGPRLGDARWDRPRRGESFAGGAQRGGRDGTLLSSRGGGGRRSHEDSTARTRRARPQGRDRRIVQRTAWSGAQRL